MAKYRKKPVVIEAMEWTGDNIAEIQHFMQDNPPGYVGGRFSNADDLLMIHTLEGDHIAHIGDFIIRDIKGEYYPVKNDIFLLTYDIVNEDCLIYEKAPEI